MCKPQKMGWSPRWNVKELADIKEFEKLKQNLAG